MREALIFIGGVAICVALYYGGGELYYRYQSARSASNLQKIADLMQIGPDIARADDGKGTVALPSGAANPTEDAPAIPATPTPETIPSGSDPATGDTSDEGDSGDAPGGDTLPVPTPEPQVMYQFSAVYDMNPDIVAWIAIDDTPVNYPVMQTKGDEEVYIQRNFEKKQDLNGLPFMDERCDIAAPTVNTIVYAHNMRNGSMFATLLKYKDEAFYKAHPIIHFTTLYEAADYEIIAAFRSRVAYVNEVTFRYYNFIDTVSPEDFDSFIDSIKGLTPYDIEHTAGFGDSLLTLSTCDRTIDDGRYVVVAKKVE
jgi:sortase B